jgi:WhiB family transcriptional regulator, redox-sensing transcriptional regulator
MDQDLSRATLWASGSWRDVGLCRNKDPNLFFPLGKGRAAFEQAEVAKAFCLVCPSREPCLAFALATGQASGVWGGTSPEERRVLLGRGRRTEVAS